MILLIDNYDSFVHNLARYFRRLGQETTVVRNDATRPEIIRRQRPDAIVLSPGPCTPNEAGCCVNVVRELGDQIPILGICLGHQAIAAAFDGKVVRSTVPMHGRTSDVYHRGTGLFADVLNPFTACRYHSLEVDADSLPDCLEATAETWDAVNMGLRHREWPVVGLQFHPESALTQYGYRVLYNFLKLAGLPLPDKIPSIDDEVRRAEPRRPMLPHEPVTF
jgi:anthranilate synthase/aminodeoxychorismate synthase-like glutamine amidotransferase